MSPVSVVISRVGPRNRLSLVTLPDPRTESRDHGHKYKGFYQCCEFNTAPLNLVSDPGFRPNFDPVPGLYRINSEKSFLKALEDKISFKIDLFIKPQEHNGTG